ncbi:MAG: hypothetical protein HQK91_00330 [Nitrospirae bacterium]|nr:hypothetical protein [Nitrospirota bacterium]MBF0539882.1 hypothetical protein [Nitrospirota bacterium]
MKSKIMALILILFIIITISSRGTTPVSRGMTPASRGMTPDKYIIMIDVCHHTNSAAVNVLDILAISGGLFYQRENHPITKLIQSDIKNNKYIIDFIIEHPPQV